MSEEKNQEGLTLDRRAMDVLVANIIPLPSTSRSVLSRWTGVLTRLSLPSIVSGINWNIGMKSKGALPCGCSLLP